MTIDSSKRCDSEKFEEEFDRKSSMLNASFANYLHDFNVSIDQDSKVFDKIDKTIESDVIFQTIDDASNLLNDNSPNMSSGNCLSIDEDAFNKFDSISSIGSKEINFENYLTRNSVVGDDTTKSDRISAQSENSFLSQKNAAKCDNEFVENTIKYNTSLLDIPDYNLFEEPTCVGLSATKDIFIRNMSDKWIYLQFLRDEDGPEVSAESSFLFHDKIICEPNDIQSTKIIFTPKIPGNFREKYLLKAYDLENKLEKDLSQEIELFTKHFVIEAQADVPKIEIIGAKTDHIDFGNIIDNMTYNYSFILKNIGSCAVPLVLQLQNNHSDLCKISFTKSETVVNSTDVYLNLDESKTIHIYLTTFINRRDSIPDKNFEKSLIFINSSLNVMLNHPSSTPIHLKFLPIIANLGFIKLHIIKSFFNNRLVSVDKSGCCCGVPIKNSGNIPFLLKCAVEYPKSSGNKNNINQSYITLSKDSYALNPNEQALIKVFFRKAPDQNEFESYFYLVLSTDPGGQIYRVRFTTELVKRTMNCELKYYVLCSHKSVYFGLVPLNESQIKTIKLKNGSSFNELQVDLLIKEESRNEFFLQTESSSTLLSAKVDLKIPPNESTTLKIHFIPNSTGFHSTNLAIKNNIDGTSHSIPLCGYGGDISVHFSDCEILDGTLSVAYGSTSATTRSLLVKNQGNIPLFILHKSKSDNKTKIIKLAVAAESKIERICYDDILSFGSSDMRDFFLQTCKDQDIKKFLDLPLLSKLFEDLSIQYQQFQDGNEIKTSHIDPRQLKIFPNDHIEFLKSLKYLTINFKNQVDNNISILKMSPNVIILKNLQPADDNFLNISNLTDKKIKIEFKEHNFLKSSENLFDIDGFSKKRISISCLPKFFPLHNFTETSLEFVANESNINHVKIFLINDCSNLIQYMENVVINSNNSKLKIINLLNIPLQFAFSYVTPNISHFHFEPSSGTLNALETKWVNILCRNQSECEERLFINICFKDTLIYSYPLHIVKTVDVSILGNKNNTENDIPFDENQGCKILSIRHEKDCNETIEYEHKKCIYALRNVITLANNQSQSKNSYREFHIKLINRCKLSDHTIVISKISHGLRCSYQQVKIKLDHFIRLPVQLDLSEVNKANTNQIDSERPTVSFETDYGEKIECEVKI